MLTLHPAGRQWWTGIPAAHRVPRRRERSQRQRPAVIANSAIRLLAIACLLIGAVACNGSDDDEPSVEESTTELDGIEWRREPTSWALQAVDGSRLTIAAVVGGDADCERFDDAEVVEGDDRVEIRAFALVRVPTADEELICEASAVLETATVELAAPLGERQLTGCVTSRPIDSVLARTDCSDIQPQI